MSYYLRVKYEDSSKFYKSWWKWRCVLKIDALSMKKLCKSSWCQIRSLEVFSFKYPDFIFRNNIMSEYLIQPVTLQLKIKWANHYTIQDYCPITTELHATSSENLYEFVGSNPSISIYPDNIISISLKTIDRLAVGENEDGLIDYGIVCSRLTAASSIVMKLLK